MKIALRSTIIIILSISMFLGLCSCRMKESYKEFNIKNITGNMDEDYFTSENFAFARLQDVVIIPEIKAINHSEYIIYLSVYSKTGEEDVQINSVLFREKETVLLDRALNKIIEFEENSESIYEGWIDGGTFTGETLSVADGKEYILVIEAEVTKNDVHVSKDVTYEIVVKGYKSFVLPT